MLKYSRFARLDATLTLVFKALGSWLLLLFQLHPIAK